MTNPTVAVFIGISQDGFIARPDGDIDWLTHERYIVPGDDFGYSAFFDTVDTVVMGRTTFEQVLAFGEWHYGETPMIVLSHQPNLVPDHLRHKVTVMAGSPAEVLRHVSERGGKRIYTDGGQVIQQFLRDGLVNELIISRMPVLIGQGIPLFGFLPHDVHLQHIETKSFSTGVVQSRYLVER